MVRVLIGDALVNEDGRLQARINQLTDRIEASLKRSLQLIPPPGALPAAEAANALVAFVIGRWHLYAKSGFRRKPTADWSQQAGFCASARNTTGSCPSGGIGAESAL